MAKFIYDSFLADVFTGNCSTLDAYKGALVSGDYVENRGHTKRSDFASLEISGSGYTAGGKAVSLSFAVNATTHVGTLTIAPVTWPSSSLTARRLIVYKSRGGSAANDELVCSIDSSSDLVTVNSTLSFPGATWTISLPAPISSGGID